MTLNPLYLINNSYPPSTSYVIDGNLTVLNATSNYGIGMTQGFYSGKWYWEVLVADVGQHLLGFLTLDDFDGQKSQPHNKFGSYLVYTNTSGQGIRYIEKSFSNITFSVSDGDIVQFALDRDNRKCWVGLNGTYIESGNPAGNSNPLFDSSDISATTGVFMPVFGTYGAQNNKQTLNAGQDSSFVGQKTSGSANATDGNGFGDFYYTPPTGFLSACSNNVPTSDDIDPAQTDDDFPQKQFGVVLYTGNGSSSARTINGFNFSPDFIWVKNRSNSNNHMVIDSSRGGDKYLFSNATNTELTSSNMITFGDSDGYVMQDDGTYLNGSSRTYVVWGWRCNGGTTASNSDGSITSTVQANQAAGFSIITYTGTGSNATIGHGLSKAPEFYIVKNRSSSENWTCYHIAAGATHYLTLNTDAVASDNATFWNDTAPTTSVISLGTNARCNGSSNNMVGYAWHSVDGYSKFGRYEGNANADGTFVYTGFRPRFLFTKNVDGVGGWRVRDTERNTDNPSDTILWWDLTQQEYTNANYSIDILSNGFKLRTSSGDFNASNTWAFGAWGDVPFKYNNTF